MEIYGRIAMWLHDILHNRTQQVLANNNLSNVGQIVSGVSQGTVLGPICFLILINTINEGDISAFYHHLLMTQNWVKESALLKML